MIRAVLPPVPGSSGKGMAKWSLNVRSRCHCSAPSAAGWSSRHLVSSFGSTITPPLARTKVASTREGLSREISVAPNLLGRSVSRCMASVQRSQSQLASGRATPRERNQPLL